MQGAVIASPLQAVSDRYGTSIPAQPPAQQIIAGPVQLAEQGRAGPSGLGHDPRQGGCCASGRAGSRRCSSPQCASAPKGRAATGCAGRHKLCPGVRPCAWRVGGAGCPPRPRRKRSARRGAGGAYPPAGSAPRSTPCSAGQNARARSYSSRRGISSRVFPRGCNRKTSAVRLG